MVFLRKKKSCPACRTTLYGRASDLEGCKRCGVTFNKGDIHTFNVGKQPEQATNGIEQANGIDNDLAAVFDDGDMLQRTFSDEDANIFREETDREMENRDGKKTKSKAAPAPKVEIRRLKKGGTSIRKKKHTSALDSILRVIFYLLLLIAIIAVIIFFFHENLTALFPPLKPYIDITLPIFDVIGKQIQENFNQALGVREQLGEKIQDLTGLSSG